MERNSGFRIVVVVWSLVVFLAPSARAQYGGGTGEPNDPYLIYTPEQLQAIGADPNDWSKHFKLMADLDLSAYTGTQYNIIGTQDTPFSGTFDGSGWTISHFTYDATDQNDVGLFGYIRDPTAEVHDLILADCDLDVERGINVGALAGYVSLGTIRACRIAGGMVKGWENVGGLVGQIDIRRQRSQGTLTACSSTATVAGKNCTGGLAGLSSGMLAACYAAGVVSGNDQTGGLVGTNSGKITHCYSVGYVDGGQGQVGGLTSTSDGMVTMSFWDIQTSGQATSAAGKGRSTAQMQMAETFRGWVTCGNEGLWTIDEGRDYPRLTWEHAPGELIVVPALSDLLAGQGTPGNPYLVWTDEEMSLLGLFPCEWDKHFKLMADIDLIEYSDELGVIGDVSTPFSGVFDGNGHTISKFTYASANEEYVGLFGRVVAGDAEIKNLGLLAVNVRASGGDCVGALAGYTFAAIISDCYVDGGIVVGGNYVGGLVGDNGSDITDCHSNGVVTGGKQVGGLVGSLRNGSLTNCHSGAAVTGDEQVGGLVGFSWHSTVDGCHSDGPVTGDESVGGLMGDNYSSIQHSSAGGTTRGRQNVGGLVGYNAGGIEDSFADGTTDGQWAAGGLAGRNSGYLRNCSADGTTHGQQCVGGLTGHNDDGTVRECYAGGRVAGDADVGGLVGYNYGKAWTSLGVGVANGPVSAGGWTILNAYATATATGQESVGGLVGRNAGAIRNCYAVGQIHGANEVGGLAGSGDGDIIVSFWDTETSGRMGSAAGDGKTTREMQRRETFVLWGACGNDGIWTIDEGKDYPRLFWEGTPGQIIGPTYLSDVLAGTGTRDDPLLILTGKDFAMLALFPCEWNQHFRLMADIDLLEFKGVSLMVGRQEMPFVGTFDGNNHTISHFTCICEDAAYIGLFGCVDGSHADIRNLGLIDPSIEVGLAGWVPGPIGSLVAYLEDGTVSNCYVAGGHVSGDKRIGPFIGSDQFVGGLVGCNRGTLAECRAQTDVTGVSAGGLVGVNSDTIMDCYAGGSVAAGLSGGGLVGVNAGTLRNSSSVSDVSSLQCAGGLVGRNTRLIANCSSGGTVSYGSYIGGLVGQSSDSSANSSNARIVNCYSSSSVRGRQVVGGLVGRNGYNGSGRNYGGTVSCCYSTGLVSASNEAGGLIGRNEVGYVEASFWNVESAGQSLSAGGHSRTTSEMQTPDTFREAGWDFFGFSDGPCDLWAVDPNSGYPILWWQATSPPMTTAFSGGIGEPNAPYLISTIVELNRIGHNPRLMSAHFQLSNDVDLAGVRLFSIGSSLFPFTGDFDGNGFTISNLSRTADAGDANGVGLFNYITGSAAVRSLNLFDSTVEAGPRDYVGTLVGHLNGSTLTDCHSWGTIVSGRRYVGGLIGYEVNGTITRCSTSGAVTGEMGVGGLVGYCRGAVTDCSATGTILGGDDIGGLVGCFDCPGAISSCCADGTVVGDNQVGGLVGSNIGTLRNSYAASGVTGASRVGGLVGRQYYRSLIACSYASGPVSGDADLGGLIGYCEGGTITSAFWDVEASGLTTSAGGTGLTTAEMMRAATFLEAGWDFVGEVNNGEEDLWWILEGQDYPRLWFEVDGADVAEGP